MPAQTAEEWEQRWQFGIHLNWVYPFDQALFKQMVWAQWLTSAWSDPLRYFTIIFRIGFLCFPLSWILFSARFQMSVSYICVTCGEWDECFSQEESDLKWFGGAFGWLHLLTFSLVVLLSQTGASVGMLIYLSLPPGKAVPLFQTWGWTCGVIRQLKSRSSPPLRHDLTGYWQYQPFSSMIQEIPKRYHLLSESVIYIYTVIYARRQLVAVIKNRFNFSRRNLRCGKSPHSVPIF